MALTICKIINYSSNVQDKDNLNKKSQLQSEDTLRSVLFWAIMQRVVIIHFRRFGTTYRSIFV